LVEVYRHFRGACCLHHQGNDEDRRLHLHTHHRENLKSHIFVVLVVPLDIRLYVQGV
jgi:hypothetical protein